MTELKNNPRDLAVDALESIDEGAYSNLELNQVIQDADLSEVDKHLLTELVYGVLQHRLTIDFYLANFLQRPEQTPRWVINLLRTAIFQMEFLDRVPTFAIFNETIEIAKRRGSDGVRKMVTGVLRSYQRQGTPSLDSIPDLTQRLATEYSVAPWIVDQLMYELGEDKCRKILDSINRPAHLSVRMNPIQRSTAAIRQSLSEEYDVQESLLATDGLRLQNGPGLAQSASFQAGEVIAQDESAMLVGETMQLATGQKVLDACAAPGGKTTQLAQKVGPDGQVIAWDIYESRTRLIQQNARRMHLTNIVTEVHDATTPCPELKEEFDCILVDAPCSGIGLLRRKPETRYLKSKKDSSDLHRVQLDILDNVASMLKVGGILTYSTCTMLRKENQMTIDEFLTQHPEFELLKTQTDKKVKADRTDLSLNIYPDDFGSDGFFIANMKKVKWLIDMKYAYLSDKGKVRKTNQDYVGIFKSDSESILTIVADGVGGNRGGDIASEMAVSHIGYLFETSDINTVEDAKNWLTHQLAIENRKILQASKHYKNLNGMGTTIVLALFINDQVVVANLGDSRCYIYNQQAGLRQLSTDHSLVNELLKTGRITPEEARNHPQKNVITKTLGISEQAEAEIKVFNVAAGDILLLCTDGLTNLVRNDVIQQILGDQQSLEAKTRKLVDLANHAGGFDNVTVLIVETEMGASWWPRIKR